MPHRRLLLALTWALTLPAALAHAATPEIFVTGNNTLYSAPLNGSALTTLTSGINDFSLGLDPVNGKLYYGSGGLNPDIPSYRSNLDGTGVEPYLTGWRPEAFDLDPAHNRLFFSPWGTSNAYVATISSPTPTTWHYGLNFPIDMQYDDTSKLLYVANTSSGTENIWAIPLDNPQGTKLIDGLYNLNGLAIDRVNRKLYYTGTNTLGGKSAIWQANMDGTNAHVIVDMSSWPGLGQPMDIDAVPELSAIFWADQFRGGVYRANLDGTNVQRILDVPNANQVAILVPEPASLSLLLFGTLTLTLRRRGA